LEERVASIFRVEEITRARKRHIPPKRRFLINPHGATSQKTAFYTLPSLKERNIRDEFTWFHGNHHSGFQRDTPWNEGSIMHIHAEVVADMMWTEAISSLTTKKPSIFIFTDSLHKFLKYC
jgi:hypothetical protein